MKLYNVWKVGFKTSDEEWLVKAYNKEAAYAKVISVGCADEGQKFDSVEFSLENGEVYNCKTGVVRSAVG